MVDQGAPAIVRIVGADIVQHAMTEDESFIRGEHPGHWVATSETPRSVHPFFEPPQYTTASATSCSVSRYDMNGTTNV
jgi:hypothetical protein